MLYKNARLVHPNHTKLHKKPLSPLKVIYSYKYTSLSSCLCSAAVWVKNFFTFRKSKCLFYSIKHTKSPDWLWFRSCEIAFYSSVLGSANQRLSVGVLAGESSQMIQSAISYKFWGKLAICETANFSLTTLKQGWEWQITRKYLCTLFYCWNILYIKTFLSN